MGVRKPQVGCYDGVRRLMTKQLDSHGWTYKIHSFDLSITALNFAGDKKFKIWTLFYILANKLGGDGDSSIVFQIWYCSGVHSFLRKLGLSGPPEWHAANIVLNH